MKRQRSWNGDKQKKTKPFARKDTPRAPLVMQPAMNIEKKYVDLIQAQKVVPGVAAGQSGTWTTIAAAYLCNGLAQGAGPNNRLGRKILMKSIYVRATHYCTAAASVSGPLRMIVVYDKQTNGAFPTATAANVVSSPLTTDHINSSNNLGCADRYITIFDKLFPPVAGATNPGAPQAATKKCYRKINLEQVFNTGNIGDITDINSGAVYIAFCSAGFNATGSVVDYMVRTRFEDS